MRQAIKQQKNITQNILPKITKNQIKIIKDLYKFRFINTYQFQKLFNHKDNLTILARNGNRPNPNEERYKRMVFEE